MHNIKVIFEPNNSKTNKYVVILTNLLGARGVKIYSLKSAFSNFQEFKSIDIAHLNWFENLDGKYSLTIILSFVKKLIKLSILKISGKKIVWTMHNKMPHDQKMLFLKKTLLRYILIASDKIIIHSKLSFDILMSYGYVNLTKIEYIPHPDYIDVYGKKWITSYSSEISPLNLLFVGAVKPYKNIELLLDVMGKFGNDVVLTIAGNPSSLEYKDTLEQYSKNSSNVKFEFKFISDAELPEYIANCDLLVLPYDITSSLNSGTVILAFSYGKTVICPMIGTVMDYTYQEGMLVYSYDGASNHQDVLYQTIRKAKDMKLEDPNVFDSMGQEMYLQTAKHNRKESVAESLEQLYRNLV